MHPTPSALDHALTGDHSILNVPLSEVSGTGMRSNRNLKKELKYFKLEF